MSKMKDVAELAGVSIKTVSRVLNNEPHVQERMRARVRDAVKKLNYIPSNSARSLRGNRSYTISLICNSHRGNYVNTIQFGAVMACQARGYQLSITLIEYEDRQKILEALENRLTTHVKPDGVLLVAPLASDVGVDKLLREHKIPVARVGSSPIVDGEGVGVEIDDTAAAREMTEYLLSLGHQRIAFVRGKEGHIATQQRFQGYEAALASKNIKVDADLVYKGQFDFKSGLVAGEKFLSLSNPPTAAFAANDDMAAGILMAAKQKGIKVPEELSVAGFDDSEIAEKIWPALTTVHQPLLKLGEGAISKLISVLGGTDTEEQHPTILAHELIVRQSTSKIKGNL
jgi:LacI family transcriptional regulator